MRMTPRLLATDTVGIVSVASFFIQVFARLRRAVHGVPASVLFPARQLPPPTWSFPCESLPSTASMPTA